MQFLLLVGAALLPLGRCFSSLSTSGPRRPLRGAEGEEEEAENGAAAPKKSPPTLSSQPASSQEPGPGDYLKLMGTSPRRLALFGGLGAAVALGGDLFGLTSTLLTNLAPEFGWGSRLDTYFAVGEFKRYVDDTYRFECLYPKNWLGDQAVYIARNSGAFANDAESLLAGRTRRGPSAIAAFGPPRGTFAENLSVFRSPLPPGFTLAKLGEPSQAAQRLLDTAIAPPASGKVTELLGARERGDGVYEFEYTIKLPNADKTTLHNLALVANHRGDLLTFTLLCKEEDWPAREEAFTFIAQSFRLL